MTSFKLSNEASIELEKLYEFILSTNADVLKQEMSLEEFVIFMYDNQFQPYQVVDFLTKYNQFISEEFRKFVEDNYDGFKVIYPKTLGEFLFLYTKCRESYHVIEEIAKEHSNLSVFLNSRST